MGHALNKILKDIINRYKVGILASLPWKSSLLPLNLDLSVLFLYCGVHKIGRAIKTRNLSLLAIVI